MNITVKEAAVRVSRSSVTVRRWCNAGKIQHIRLPSGQYLIPTDALKQLLEPK